MRERPSWVAPPLLGRIQRRDTDGGHFTEDAVLQDERRREVDRGPVPAHPSKAHEIYRTGHRSRGRAGGRPEFPPGGEARERVRHGPRRSLPAREEVRGCPGIEVGEWNHTFGESGRQRRKRRIPGFCGRVLRHRRLDEDAIPLPERHGGLVLRKPHRRLAHQQRENAGWSGRSHSSESAPCPRIERSAPRALPSTARPSRARRGPRTGLGRRPAHVQPHGPAVSLEAYLEAGRGPARGPLEVGRESGCMDSFRSAGKAYRGRRVGGQPQRGHRSAAHTEQPDLGRKPEPGARHQRGGSLSPWTTERSY